MAVCSRIVRLQAGSVRSDRSPALADRAGWCWRIGVPKRFGTSAPEFRAFCDACASGSYADGACFTWPSWDILPAEEVKQARDTLDPKDFNEQFGASWETVGGGIFYAFSREYNVRPVEYHRDRAIIVGSDFNVDPMCWTIGHTYPDRIEWFDEIFLRDANTIGTLDVLYQRYQDHCGGFQFYGDATGKARDTAAAETDYAQIMNDRDSSGWAGRCTIRRAIRARRTGSPPATRCS
jgi:hypothetical protein